MAITLMGSTPIYEGINKDEKPTDDIMTNAKFHELDTDDWYYFDGTAWQKVGGDNEGT